ncbi:MAG: energy transducer TonB [Sphingomicrobium sp.]
MLDYAARYPVAAKRGSSPNALLMIITAHVAALAVLMSARMELPPRIDQAPIKIDFIHAPKPPPPNPITPPAGSPIPAESTLHAPHPIVPTPITVNESADASPAIPNLGPILGIEPKPLLTPAPVIAPPSAAQLLTPPAELKPPYPQSKLVSEEQAVLRLRLSIDERGRVVAVTPVGRADPAFLDAARRHIIAHWRYRPASESGRAIVSSAVITLHFELNG